MRAYLTKIGIILFDINCLSAEKVFRLIFICAFTVCRSESKRDVLSRAIISYTTRRRSDMPDTAVETY